MHGTPLEVRDNGTSLEAGENVLDTLGHSAKRDSLEVRDNVRDSLRGLG